MSVGLLPPLFTDPVHSAGPQVPRRPPDQSAHGNGPDRKGTWHYPADHERAGKRFFYPGLLTSVTFPVPGSRSPDPCGLWHHTKAFNLTRTRHHEVRENSPGPDNADGQGYAGSMQQKIPKKNNQGNVNAGN